MFYEICHLKNKFFFCLYKFYVEIDKQKAIIIRNETEFILGITDEHDTFFMIKKQKNEKVKISKSVMNLEENLNEYIKIMQDQRPLIQAAKSKLDDFLIINLKYFEQLEMIKRRSKHDFQLQYKKMNTKTLIIDLVQFFISID